MKLTVAILFLSALCAWMAVSNGDLSDSDNDFNEEDEMIHKSRFERGYDVGGPAAKHTKPSNSTSTTPLLGTVTVAGVVDGLVNGTTATPAPATATSEAQTATEAATTAAPGGIGGLGSLVPGGK